MKILSEKGLTLVELLLSVTLLALLGGAAGVMVSASLDANQHVSARSKLYQEGFLTMNRIVSGLRKTTYVLVPNGHKPSRDILAFSRLVNSDNDFYFGDPMFPRIDEDTWSDLTIGAYGIKGVDEDGDGLLDEGPGTDEDEDGYSLEDRFDGLDNDGDGSIDEEVNWDSNLDGWPGVRRFDEDGDGLVDEGLGGDDDEDGRSNEEDILMVVYSHNAPAATLTEIHPDPATGIYDPAPKIVLSDRVTGFEAFLESPERIRITLTLTGDDGESVTFTEYVCPRNVLQKTGKRVL